MTKIELMDGKYTYINHEDRARECERLAAKCKVEACEYGTDTDTWHGCADICKKEAAAHRAKKEGK